MRLRSLLIAALGLALAWSWVGSDAGDALLGAPPDGSEGSRTRRQTEETAVRSTEVRLTSEASFRGAPGEPRRHSVLARRSAVPAWVVESIDVESEDGPLRSNRDPEFSAERLSPRDLRVLSEIIEANRLGEDSSGHDFDDGDGLFEPWELGYQVWQGDRLIVLTLGPDPFGSFGYEIDWLPDSISELQTLQFLDAHGNALESLPVTIGDLVALRDLRLQDNQLSELPPELGALYRLRQLVLGANELAGLPDSIGDLRALERLHLADNPLEALPETVGNLTGLRELSIVQRNEDVRGLTWLPDGVAQLPELEKLYLAGNRLGCGNGALWLTGGVLVFGAGSQFCP